MKYWEDFTIGERAELGSHTFTEEEIIAFGRQYDPQAFHIDTQKARDSAFGGLIASGWQTCAVGSPGIDAILWLKPVRPGDTVTYRRVVTASRASATRKGVGLVKHRWEALNQRGELVLSMEGWGMFGRKD